MSWTATIVEGHEGHRDDASDRTIPLLHVRAIIDIDNEQAELKELIASLGKHVKMEAPVT